MGVVKSELANALKYSVYSRESLPAKIFASTSAALAPQFVGFSSIQRYDLLNRLTQQLAMETKSYYTDGFLNTVLGEKDQQYELQKPHLVSQEDCDTLY